MAKIIILNGPAGVGKDTIGNALHYDYRCIQTSFKRPMFEIAESILGAGAFSKFITAYDDRDQKEMPQSFLGGKTCREFMIWISESVVKPLFGNQQFGKLMSEHIKLCDEGLTFVCTDGGFADEVIQLVEDGHDVTLVRLFMEGKTFAGDSRNYIRIKESHFPDYKKYQEHSVRLVNGDIGGGVLAVAEACGLTSDYEWVDDIPW
ncbi:putative P-loop NTPase protein [Escherichia phage AugustePiccard]|uniref:P-loop NTPase protein n=1 Tax=Escherichia phage AugustePiccard TaxID=2851954 RepID=A0AAE7VPA0_9CAUD|nr:putative P-loop NTPase protein [Escherichia phage AugustePiccard]